MKTYKTITVKVSDPGSGNRFYFDDVLTPTLGIHKNKKYIFDQSDASNNTHQLYFSSTKDGTHAVENGYVIGEVFLNGVDYYLDNVRVHPDVYKDNTNFAAATTRHIHWRVPDDAPGKMYPVCKNHSGMYANGYFNLNPTDLATGALIDRVQAQAATASAKEVSNLAKTLNNVESTTPDNVMHWGSKIQERGDAGPEVTWSARDAEFIVWGGQYHHNHDGGGGESYDSMLDIVNLRKYSGFHCYDGNDDGYEHQGWRSMQLHYYGECYWFYRTQSSVNSNQCYAAGTDKISEIGHHNLNINVDGSPSHFSSCYSNFTRTHEGMQADSWEVRDNRYYVSTEANQVMLKDRWFSGMEGTTAPASMKVVSPSVGNKVASSYNRKRKEAVFMSKARQFYNRYWGFANTIDPRNNEYQYSGYEDHGTVELGQYHDSNFKIIVYKDVPYITGNTNLAKVLDDNNRDTFMTNWLYGNHHYSNFKIALSDNGSIFAVNQYHQAYFHAARFQRTSDNKAIRFQHMGTQYCNDCRNYMQDVGSKSCGVRVVQSRNKRNVALFGSYYYYSAGSNGWMISRDFDRAQGDVIYCQNTTHGVQIMPFRDADFYLHMSTDQNDTSNYNRGGMSVVHQDGRGWFRRYSVGLMLDGVGHSTNYGPAIPIHHDGLNY